MDSKQQDTDVEVEIVKQKNTTHWLHRNLCYIVGCIVGLSILVGVVVVIFSYTVWDNRRGPSPDVVNVDTDTATVNDQCDVTVTVKLQNELIMGESVANTRTDTHVLCGPEQSLYMHLTSGDNLGIVFEEFGGLGHYVSSVRGVAANHSMETYWALLIERAEGLCASDRGVDSLYPKDDDVIVMRLVTYAESFPSCAGGDWDELDGPTTRTQLDVSSFTIKLTIENQHTAPLTETFTSYREIEVDVGETLLSVVEKLRENRSYEFTLAEDKQIGRYIHGIENVNSTRPEESSAPELRLAWIVMKSIPDALCLLPPGLGYIGLEADDDIRITYMPCSIYGKTQYCNDNDVKHPVCHDT